MNFESEVLLKVLDYHHEEGELDAEGALGVGGAGDEGCGDVGAHYLEDGGLDVLVGYALDVAVADCEIKLEKKEGKRRRNLPTADLKAPHPERDFFPSPCWLRIRVNSKN